MVANANDDFDDFKLANTRSKTGMHSHAGSTAFQRLTGCDTIVVLEKELHADNVGHVGQVSRDSLYKYKGAASRDRHDSLE